MTRIIWHSPAGWQEEDHIAALHLPGRVISLVGGGGKSTLLYHLAEHFAACGHKTAALTTTKLYLPRAFCTTAEDCEALWQRGQYALCGQPLSPEKLGPPPPALLDWLLTHADRVLIEADGARRMACKMPRAHEPVLLPACDTVVGIMGLDVLGQPVEEVCFHPELICAHLGCPPDHRLTPADLASILLSPQGTRKHVGQRNYCVVLNKCDDPARQAGGRAVVSLLEAQGHSCSFLTRLQ